MTDPSGGRSAAGAPGWLAGIEPGLAVRKEAADEVGAVEPLQGADDVATVGGVVPEEVFALAQFVVRVYGCVNFLAGIGMYARVVDFSRDGHGCGREVLYLLEMHAEVFGLGCEFGHVDFAATGM